MHAISTVSAQAAMEYIFANPSRRDFASSTAAMMAIMRGISISWETTFAPMANVGGTLISTYARISSSAVEHRPMEASSTQNLRVSFTGVASTCFSPRTSLRRMQKSAAPITGSAMNAATAIGCGQPFNTK